MMDNLFADGVSEKRREPIRVNLLGISYYKVDRDFKKPNLTYPKIFIPRLVTDAIIRSAKIKAISSGATGGGDWGDPNFVVAGAATEGDEGRSEFFPLHRVIRMKA